MNNKNQIKNHYRGNLEKGAKDRGIMDKVHNEKIMHDMNKEQKRQVCERDVDCHLNRISNKCQQMIDKNLLTIEVNEKSYSEALEHFKREMIFRLEVFLSNHASLYSCIDDSVPIKNVFVSFLLMMFKIR